MSYLAPRELGALAVGAAAVAGVIVLLAVYGPRWWNGSGGSYAPRDLVTSAGAVPVSFLFGDVVTLHGHVMVDRRTIDPRAVTMDARFSPFRLVSQAQAVHPLGSRAARVDYTVRLQCVTADCLRAGGREIKGGAVMSSPIVLPPALVTARRRDGTSAQATLPWPKLTLHSRLTPAQISSGELSAGPLPSGVSYTISPDLAGGLLVAAGVLFALGAGYLLASAVRGKPAPRRLRIPAHLTPLERALALVRVAADDQTDAEARKALERLATELRRSGYPELTATAGRLAWSPERPSQHAVEELVTEVSRSVNGR